jgi:hypothetical protein
MYICNKTGDHELIKIFRNTNTKKKALDFRLKIIAYIKMKGRIGKAYKHSESHIESQSGNFHDQVQETTFGRMRPVEPGPELQGSVRRVRKEREEYTS